MTHNAPLVAGRFRWILFAILLGAALFAGLRPALTAGAMAPVEAAAEVAAETATTATLNLTAGSSPAGGTDFPVLLGFAYDRQYGPSVTYQFDTLYQPTDVAVDPSGNVYIIDSGLGGTPRVVKYNSAGAYQTSWEGGGTAGTTFNSSLKPQGIATDANGYVYVADAGNHRILVFDNNAGFRAAFGKDVDSADASTGYEVCLIAANCQAGTSGGLGGEMNQPYDVTVDPSGAIYVADTQNYRIQKFSSAGVFQWASGRDVTQPDNAAGGIAEVCTVAANCRAGEYGSFSGQFNVPKGLAADATSVYVADTFNSRVQVLGAADGFFDLTWGIEVDSPTNFGSPQFEYCTSDPCESGLSGSSVGYIGGSFGAPEGIAADGQGNVVVADESGLRFQMFHYGTEFDSLISSYVQRARFSGAWGKDVAAGNAETGFEMCTTSPGCKRGVVASNAPFGGPTGAAFDPSGNILILDSNQAYQFNRQTVQVDQGETETLSLAPGSYRLDAFVPGGWMLNAQTPSNAISCSGGGGPQINGRGVSLTLADDDNVTCNFNYYLLDTANGSIQVEKSLPNGTSGSFTICVGGGPGSLPDDCKAFINDGATQTWRGLAPGGGYVISEDDPGSGWVPPDPITVSVSAATTTQAAVANTQTPGSITVVKDVTIFGSGILTTNWTYTGTLGSFNLDAMGGQTTFNNLTPGSYTLTEIGQAGFYPIGPNCGFGNTYGSNGSVTFTLDPGEDATCTFSSNEDLGSLTIVKVVEGDIPAANWAFSLDGEDFTLPAAGGQESFTYAAGNYIYSGPHTITETADPNYDTVASCDTGDSGGAVVTPVLGFGVAATCTFTNTYSPALPGSLMVTKAISGTGYPADPQFEICLGGGPDNLAADCRTVTGDGGQYEWTNLTPGAGYVVSESDAGPDWDEPGNQTVSVPKGGQQTVTVTNAWDPVTGGILVTKVISGTGYPPDPLFEICVSGGPDDLDPDCQTFAGERLVEWNGLPEGDGYVVSESDAGADWTEPDNQTVSVTAGSQTPVTVTNEYTPVPVGSIRATKKIVGSGYDPDPVFEVCVGGGPDNLVNTCKGVTGDGGSAEWPGLTPGGGYVVSESPAGLKWDEPAVQTVTVSADIQTGVTITNTYTPLEGMIAFTNTPAGENENVHLSPVSTGNILDVAVGDTADLIPRWSADGTRLYFASNRFGNFEIIATETDGSGAVNLTATPDDFEYYLDVSDDGTKVAFSRMPNSGGNPDLWVMDADGGNPIRLTNTPDDSEEMPAWSPDGTQLAFVRNGDIWIMDDDGGNARQLTSHAWAEMNPDWSPDGTAILFERAFDRGDIIRIKPDGTGEQNLTTDFGGPGLFFTSPIWSPAGNRVAFALPGVIVLAESDFSEFQPLNNPDGDFTGYLDWLGTPTTGAIRVGMQLAGTGYPPNPAFEVCLSGGALAAPDCKTITGAGMARWGNLPPANNYVVTQTDPGSNWQIMPPESGLEVRAGQRTDVYLLNRWGPPASGDPTVWFLTSNGSGRAGGVPYDASDILRYDKTTNQWTKAYDGSTRGTPANLAAFAIDGEGSLLLVWAGNQKVTIGGVKVTATPRDIVRFSPDTPNVYPLGPGTYEWFFRGADHQLTTDAEKIDAIDVTGERLMLSATGNAAVGPGNSIKAQDEDVLAYDTGGSGWSSALELDGTPIPGMGVEDVNGFWKNTANNNRYLTIAGAFTIGNNTYGKISGNGKTIVRLEPNALAPGKFVPYVVNWLAPGAAFPTTLDGIEAGP